MRKYLLFVFAAFTAMTVNAQKAASNRIVSAEQLSNKYACDMPKTNVKALSSIASVVAKAPALNDLKGNYIEDNVADIHESYPASIALTDSNTVIFNFNGAYNCFMEGKYDPETGVITCPAQDCGSYTNTSTKQTFKFAVYGIADIDFDKGTLSLTDTLTFTVADNKTITTDQKGYTLLITESTDESAVGKLWNYALETTFVPVNATMSGKRNVIADGGWSGWLDYSMPVAIEDFEFAINVYGFCEMTCVSIDINDDGTVSFPMGQPTMALPDQYVETYGEYFTIKGIGVDDEGYMYIDDNITEIKGTISGNQIILDNTFINCSNLTEDGYGLFDGYYRMGTAITLNDGNYLATGIKEVKATREEIIKNTKTYNLMGQQVDRATTKGLLIRGGKKYISK